MRLVLPFLLGFYPFLTKIYLRAQKVFTVATLINGLDWGEIGCWVNGRTSLGLRLP